jgi:hypothetical protein
MAGRDHDAARQPALLDGEEGRRSGNEAEIADSTADRLEPGGGGAYEDRSARARVPSHGDPVSPPFPPDVGAEGGGGTDDDLRVEVDPYTPADSGDTDYQAVGEGHAAPSRGIRVAFSGPQIALHHDGARLLMV